jgi:hypothetical protein
MSIMAPERLMKLRYGVNEAHGWREFALGAGRHRIWDRLRALDTRLIGISVFGPHASDPLRDWPSFAAAIDAVLGVGAIPVITFARLYPPHDSPTTARWFAGRCADLVWNCVEQWGRERVREWTWCIGSSANSDWVNPGLTFDRYRSIYVRVVEAMLRWLPSADGGRPLIGGPGIDTFQPFWFDWIWRLAHAIDDELIGVATWHQYGDWRAPGECGAPAEEGKYRALLMRHVGEYADRAQTIARAVRGRRLLSLCTRINAHAHHERSVSGRFNQTLFGAASYVSGLLQLMRADTDGEMFWMGTDSHGPYGLWDHAGNATPVFHAKRLCARYVRYGDGLVFPVHRLDQPIDAVIARGADGRESLVLVHRSELPMRYPVAELAGEAAEYDTVMTIDGSSPPEGHMAPCDGEVRFEGYGVAVATTRIADGERPRPRVRAQSALLEKETASAAPARMQLRYGFNEADSWWHFAHGPQRERIWARLRALRPRVVRIFLFDKSAPDPVSDWPQFAAYVQAVLNLGAVPMVTFAKSPRSVDDARGVRWFATRCADVVWSCMDQWGEQVGDWYWCVWNEPNSTWIGGGLSFEQYRRVYEEVASGILRWLGPLLRGRRPLIGGPAVEGFPPFWLDWVARFLTEIDHSLIGFVNWHRYSDWRAEGEKDAPRDPAVLRALMLAQTPEYELRARAVSRIAGESGILNVCGEWNAHSHYLPQVRARFNQSLFGAVHGAAALLHLMRGGVDAEMLWTGTDDECGYGVLDKDGRPTPLYHAKRLFAEHVRTGDELRFFVAEERRAAIDGVIAWGEAGRRSALLVHLLDTEATYDLAELAGHDVAGFSTLLKLDRGTPGGPVAKPMSGTLTFEGQGVAVVTNVADASREDEDT